MRISVLRLNTKLFGVLTRTVVRPVANHQQQCCPETLVVLKDVGRILLLLLYVHILLAPV